ncbi:MAG: response regulator transcription factor [Myxococcales bacterium]|nr:response regulator transcription factor [Myxococcales bacterium]
MNSKTFILVAEDDTAIATGLAMNLELEGYRSLVVEDGVQASEVLNGDRAPDLVLLDIGMPRKDGLELLNELRAAGNKTPVIVLSARLSESDKVAALRLGADDYVTKPFALAELMARISAVLRRSQAAAQEIPPPPRPIAAHSFGEIRVDRTTRVVTRNDDEVALTHLEFELLCFFTDNPGRVLGRDRILSSVWGTSGSRRTVDNFVAQLRSKLEVDPEAPKHFITVRGSGYRFVA